MRKNLSLSAKTFGVWRFVVRDIDRRKSENDTGEERGECGAVLLEIN